MPTLYMTLAALLQGIGSTILKLTTLVSIIRPRNPSLTVVLHPCTRWHTLYVGFCNEPPRRRRSSITGNDWQELVGEEQGTSIATYTIEALTKTITCQLDAFQLDAVKRKRCVQSLFDSETVIGNSCLSYPNIVAFDWSVVWPRACRFIQGCRAYIRHPYGKIHPWHRIDWHPILHGPFAMSALSSCNSTLERNELLEVARIITLTDVVCALVVGPTSQSSHKVYVKQL